MIDKDFLEKELGSLDLNELKEVEKIISELKKKLDTREEFLDMLKRYAEKYPGVRLFCTGSAGKGAYECEGEWFADNWNDVWDDKYSEIYKLIYEKLDEDSNNSKEDIDFLKSFNSFEDFEKSILNVRLHESENYSKQKEYKNFVKDLKNSLHFPKWDVSDAEYLSNGETCYGFVDIETGRYFCYYTSVY